ncbi:MAG: MFS transporter [Geminicoccaceae bacterium]|nr:MFS transporter [Geminicoccaceae bacterium]
MPPALGRNTVVLALAQAINGSLAPISISLGGLAGYALLGPDKGLATAPVTGYNVGVALASLPAALLMRRVGRRAGFMTGASIGACGGLLAAYAITVASFWLFALGLFVVGTAGSFVQQYRFAAVDGAEGPAKGRVIGWVLAGGLIAAVVGPQTAIHTRDLLAPIPFAGAFLGLAGLAAVGCLVLAFLRPPPLPATAAPAGGGRPLGEIVRQPTFVVAVACAVGSYALMSFVMTAAPLAMVAAGCTTDEATLGIQWHVMAMFGPSFVTGNLVARFGARRVIAVGLGILGTCALVALSGTTLAHFWGTLILLGVGWNLGFIGATTLLTETYAPEEKNKAQGANDVVLFGTVALASFSSGQILNAFGWSTVAAFVLPVIALCLAALGWLGLRGRAAVRSAV